MNEVIVVLRRVLRSTSLPRLEQALRSLGYTKNGKRPLNWHNGKFHLIIKVRRNKTILHIHVDTPLPMHKTRHYGEDLRGQLNQITTKLYQKPKGCDSP